MPSIAIKRLQSGFFGLLRTKQRRYPGLTSSARLPYCQGVRCLSSSATLIQPGLMVGLCNMIKWSHCLSHWPRRNSVLRWQAPCCSNTASMPRSRRLFIAALAPIVTHRRIEHSHYPSIRCRPAGTVENPDQASACAVVDRPPDWPSYPASRRSCRRTISYDGPNYDHRRGAIHRHAKSRFRS